MTANNDYVPADLKHIVESVFFWEKDYGDGAIAELAEVRYKYPYVSKEVYSNGDVRYESRRSLLMESEWESFVRNHTCKLSKLQYWWYMYEKQHLREVKSNIRYGIRKCIRNIRTHFTTVDDALEIIRAECNKQKSCVNCKHRYYCESRTEKLIKFTHKYQHYQEEEDEDEDY